MPAERDPDPETPDPVTPDPAPRETLLPGPAAPAAATRIPAPRGTVEPVRAAGDPVPPGADSRDSAAPDPPAHDRATRNPATSAAATRDSATPDADLPDTAAPESVPPVTPPADRIAEPGPETPPATAAPGPAGAAGRGSGRPKDTARRLRDGIRQRVRAALSAAVPGLLDAPAPTPGPSAIEAGKPRPGANGIVVGFSGGPDSTALLHLVLDALARRRGEPRAPVVAAHLDHALRPDSAEQARFAKDAAAALGVPFVGDRRPVAERARRERASLEAAARAERLDFLAEAAQARGAATVALGHTASDQAETVLLQLLRGAGGLGLSAMPPHRDDSRGIRIVRPLLTTTRAEVAALVASEGWASYADPSNESPDFTRNRLRREVLPLLRETANPAADRALARAAALLRDDETFLAAAAAARWREIAEIRVEDGRPAARAPAAKLRELPPALARRVVREGLSAVRGHLRRLECAHIEAVRSLASAGRGGTSCDLPGARVSLDRGVLTFRGVFPGKEPEPPPGVGPGTADPRAYNAGRLPPDPSPNPPAAGCAEDPHPKPDEFPMSSCSLPERGRRDDRSEDRKQDPSRGKGAPR